MVAPVSAVTAHSSPSRTFDPEPEEPPRYQAGRDAFAAVLASGVPACVTDALAYPASVGNLGALALPMAFDPVVYVAISRRVQEVVYVGRTYDLAGRIARHRRAFEEVGAWWPDLWAWMKVAAPDAPHVEEGLIRTWQDAGHPAHLLHRRSAYAGGHLVSGQQREAMMRHGLVRV